ncbi:PrcB C-terminal [Rubrobacter radiotolerans DSM 5868]|nr:PrcB C-terminal [Rubrobacter radiotolerans DSM 5868]
MRKGVSVKAHPARRSLASPEVASLSASLVAGIFAAVLMSACASSEPAESGPSETSAPEATAGGRELNVEEVFSGDAGSGSRERPGVVLSAEPEDLPVSGASQVERTGPQAGEVFYAAVFAGERPTGGYDVEVRDAVLRGERVVLEVALIEPPEEAIVTQALTYPFTVVEISGTDLQGREVRLTDEEGRDPGWPVEVIPSG